VNIGLSVSPGPGEKKPTLRAKEEESALFLWVREEIAMNGRGGAAIRTLIGNEESINKKNV